MRFFPAFALQPLSSHHLLTFCTCKSDNYIHKVLTLQLPDGDVVHETPFGPDFGVVLHSAFQANNNQRDFDLHRGDPRLSALLQQILVHDFSGLSLFRLCLHHDQMLLVFAIVDERLSLDEHFFNGELGNVAVSDLITTDSASVGGNTTSSAIPLASISKDVLQRITSTCIASRVVDKDHGKVSITDRLSVCVPFPRSKSVPLSGMYDSSRDDLETKNSLPAQDTSWSFFHNPSLIVCPSIISINPGGHRTHACAPTNPSAPAEADGNGEQSVNATEPQQGESVADVMGMHNDRSVAALPKKKESKAALRNRKRKEAYQQRSSAADKKKKEEKAAHMRITPELEKESIAGRAKNKPKETVTFDLVSVLCLSPMHLFHFHFYSSQLTSNFTTNTSMDHTLMHL